MMLKKEKAMDLLIRYLKFTKEEAEILKESITSITVNNKATSMDFTILAVVLLLCGGIPLRNKIYKERKKKKEDKKKGI